jgi:nucleoid DNA-binding protein
MPLTQTQLADAVAERSGLSRAQAKGALQALEDVVLSEIGNAEKVKIVNLVQLTVRVKPATKAPYCAVARLGLEVEDVE